MRAGRLLLALLAAAPAAAQHGGTTPLKPVQLPAQPPKAPVAMPPAPPPAGAALPGAARLPKDLGPGIVSKTAPINGVLTLFGNERCPTDSDGNEIVVCVRRGAAEQFRVPKELREFQVTADNQSWATKAQASLDTSNGVSTAGTCTASGGGGMNGCFLQQARAARAENKAKRDAEAEIP